MYGWRANIGLLVPTQNVTIEPEFYLMAPEGVAIHTARMFYEKPEMTIETLEQIGKGAEDAAVRVARAGVDIVVFGCTTGSLVKGVGYDRELKEKLEKITNLPAVTTSTAVLKAFETLGLKKVAIASPYTKEVNKKVVEFVEGNGYKVTKIKGLEHYDMTKIGKETGTTSYRLAKEVNTSDADGVFVSCTDFRTIDILCKLENDLGKPVVSSNQATMWTTLREIGIKEHLEGFGVLLHQS
ncbi:MAG: maleate cis-trans isomerase [Nitrososphaeria archaeon]|nr:maleate cis-trans isomerase [Nitrososphaeria archaeon]NIN53547.1 maleate cis-trans isomerase [Nitrososphaeria archaeon]NIQ34066.1 maleate cis-trans isomerase [Nitrososphaeria archaeon]